MDTGRDTLTCLEYSARVSTVRNGSALAYIDLRSFRERVNEPYGEEVGDRVIRTVAHRLRDGLAPNRVFRFGGTDFVVEITGPLDREDAADLARRIAALIAEPIEGIAEPLEAWVGLSLRRVAENDVLAVRIEVERAANVLACGSGVPFIVFPDSS